MGIKRIIKRTFEEVRATYMISKVTSIREAITTFMAKVDIQVLSRNGYKENKRQKKRLLKKHDIMMKYFNITFKEFLNNYEGPKISNEDIDMSDTIWVCWWQGYDQAPEVVKNCIDSIRNNCGSKNVIIIDENNYKNYVHIPDWVEKKKNEGVISRTHFSDITRLCLLAEHGGLWLDSTFFCIDSLEPYFNYPLWSIKRPDYLHCSIAGGSFATYSLRCSFENRWIFKTILDLYLHYWSINEKQLDYLTLDYMFVLAQQIDEEIKKEFNEIISNNPNCDELFKVINNSFNIDEWEQIKKNTKLFKLSWKCKFDNENNTYYKMLNDKKLK